MSRHLAARLPAVVLTVLAAAPAAAEEVIPFDTTKATTLADRNRAWVESVTQAAYQAVGKRDAKWDADAAAAFRAYRDVRCGPFWGAMTANVRLREAARGAVEAGCDDPLVRCLAVRTRAAAADGDADAADADPALEAARRLADSKYPAVWKAQAYLWAAEALVARGRDRPAVEGCRAELVKQLAAAARDKDPVARREVGDLCDQVQALGARVGRRKEWFDRVEAEVLAGLPADDARADLCAGWFLSQYAWDARGGGPAATVTPGGRKLFLERLDEAARRLEAAWDRDNTCAPAASAMVVVCMGRGKDREEMETWFRRAVTADPTRTDVFDRKMLYLQPKWHGSAEEALAFGRQAAELGLWDTAVPVLLLQAHEGAAAASGEGVKYYERPEVWKEVGPVLEEIRKRHPKSPLGASVYLYHARLYDRNGAEAHAYVRAQALTLPLTPFKNALAQTGARVWAETAAEKK